MWINRYSLVFPASFALAHRALAAARSLARTAGLLRRSFFFFAGSGDAVGPLALILAHLARCAAAIFARTAAERRPLLPVLNGAGISPSSARREASWAWRESICSLMARTALSWVVVKLASVVMWDCVILGRLVCQERRWGGDCGAVAGKCPFTRYSRRGAEGAETMRMNWKDGMGQMRIAKWRVGAPLLLSSPRRKAGRGGRPPEDPAVQETPSIGRKVHCANESARGLSGSPGEAGLGFDGENWRHSPECRYGGAETMRMNWTDGEAGGHRR